MFDQKIIKAGAIVLSKEDKNNILMLYRGKENDWSFPKGHSDAGEDLNEAMTREIKEETGLEIEIIKSLPNNTYNNSRGEIVSTYMFLVKSVDDSKLKKEFEGDSLEWVPFDEVWERLSYDNLKNYYHSVSTLVKDS